MLTFAGGALSPETQLFMSTVLAPIIQGTLMQEPIERG